MCTVSVEREQAWSARNRVDQSLGSMSEKNNGKPHRWVKEIEKASNVALLESRELLDE